MAIEIKTPSFPESVQNGTIATWHKEVGDRVERDELLVDIETDKVVLEVVAPAAGRIAERLKSVGAEVESNEVIARLEEITETVQVEKSEVVDDKETLPSERRPPKIEDRILSPAARKLMEERNLDPGTVTGTGKGGRITKEDVLNYSAELTVAESKPRTEVETAENLAKTPAAPSSILKSGERTEKRIPMTRMRARIAERLLQVNQQTAMLTTFNEVDLHRVMDLRAEFKDLFSQVHNGTRLGYMGFFVRASVEALKRFSAVNASIDGDDIVYHGYYDIGVAVSTDRGLVVPVLRDADRMSIADIESSITEYGARARENKLTINEMTGGTFTITNGGVFGSLLSTPILNPPQTAILGMHKIQDRPIAENGEVVVRPMMYLALSYDHRLIDGKDAVQFLSAIKEMIEHPAKILLEI